MVQILFTVSDMLNKINGSALRNFTISIIDDNRDVELFSASVLGRDVGVSESLDDFIMRICTSERDKRSLTAVLDKGVVTHSMNRYGKMTEIIIYI